MSTDKSRNPKKQPGKVKAFQEINDEIRNNKELKERQPSIQPQDMEDIEY